MFGVVFGMGIGVLGVGCDQEAYNGEESDDSFRAQPDHSCTYTKGDIGKSCNGNNCVTQLDLEISCPDDVSTRSIQVALSDKRIWGHFDSGVGELRSFRVQGQGLVWQDPLPGRDFTGQAVDGTMHRHLDDAAYLRSTNSGWQQVAVPGLPVNYDSAFGFRIRPDGAGGMHASFRTGIQSGAYRFATQANDDSWSWISLGSWDPNVTDEYVGKDAWDRTFSLVHTLDWEDGPQILLNFQHFDNLPVGESGEFGRLANPPRPDLGGDAPIATLRRTPDIHKLLTIVDGDDWTETEIVGTEPMTGGCPLVFNSNVPICAPCHADLDGIEDDAYQLARTSGGQLWGVWFESQASVDVEYVVVPRGIRWRCEGTLAAQADGTLHLAELAADGSIGRTLDLEFDDVGFVPNGSIGKRDLAVAAFGDEVAVLFPAHHGDELVMRLMVFDTSKLD